MGLSWRKWGGNRGRTLGLDGRWVIEIVRPTCPQWRLFPSIVTYSVNDRWKGLRNALAGLFCASLGSMDELRTTSPTQSFLPEGSLPQWDAPHQIRHASLPSENVCTENLTPFLKLLPCKSFSGIASLLNPHRLFDANWHGMGVHVLWRENLGVEVRLTFQSVSDPLRGGLGNKQGEYKFLLLCTRAE